MEARPTCRFSGLFPSRKLFIAESGTIAAALEANELISVHKLFLAKKGLLPNDGSSIPFRFGSGIGTHTDTP
jgi:hypothetical protein